MYSYGTSKGLVQPRTNQSRLDNTKHQKNLEFSPFRTSAYLTIFCK
jgi:hypothetical protein